MNNTKNEGKSLKLDGCMVILSFITLDHLPITPRTVFHGCQIILFDNMNAKKCPQ